MWWIKHSVFVFCSIQHGSLKYFSLSQIPFIYFLLVIWRQASMGYSSTITSHSVRTLWWLSCWYRWSSSSTLTYLAITGGSHTICMCPQRIDAWSDVTGTPHAALLKMSLSVPALTTAPDNRLSVNEKLTLYSLFKTLLISGCKLWLKSNNFLEKVYCLMLC